MILKRGARKCRYTIPIFRKGEGTTILHRRLHARVETGAHGIVAAKTHARYADTTRVKIIALREYVERSGDGNLVIGTNRQLIAALALTRPLQRERRHAAREEHIFPMKEFFFRTYL